MSDQDDDQDLLGEAAFTQIEVDVTMENLTSGTGVAGDLRTFGGKFGVRQGTESRGLQLMEITAKGVALDAPSKVAAPGHVVRLNFDVSGAKIPYVFAAKGTVENVSPLEDSRDKLEITLTEFDPEYIEALRSIFDRRQAEIDEFLEAVRG